MVFNLKYYQEMKYEEMYTITQSHKTFLHELSAVASGTAYQAVFR